MKKSSFISAPNKVRLFMLVNVVVLFFLVVAFGREYVGNIQIEREIRQLEAENARLENERLDTLDLIDDLSSEEYLEREARTKHGLAESGETLVVIQDPEAGVEETIFSSDEDLEAIENPERWFFYFFDKERFRSLSSS